MSIAFRGVGALITGTTSPQTPDIDATGYQLNDFGLLVAGSRTTAGATIASTGYTADVSALETSSSPDIDLHDLFKILAASESDPSVTNSSPGNGWGAFLLAYSGVNTTTPRDTTSQTGTSTIQDSVAPSITTVTANAWVVSIALAFTSDANGVELKVGSEQGFTPRASGASYRTASPVLAFAVADKLIATPGAVTGPTWRNASGSNPKAMITVALRPATADDDAGFVFPRGEHRGEFRGEAD